MKQSPRQAELKLQLSEHHQYDTFAERHYTDSDADETHSIFYEEAIHPHGEAGALDDFHESYNQHYGNANGFSQSHVTNIGLGSERTASHGPHPSHQSPRFGPQDDSILLRGVEKYVELSSPGYRGRELRRGETHFLPEGPTPGYNMHRRSFSLEGPSLAPMPSLPQPSSRHSSAPPQAAGQHYSPFRDCFRSSQEAKDYRHSRMRFDRHPWLSPNEDPTIDQVERDRRGNVERIYNAMINGDVARDNDKSTALKRWVREPHYQSDLVEAYAHKVFDCLLEQVKIGFRGWHQNDYVNDERKGEDEDRDVNCAGRLENIITALEQEKSICENVMSSAWQIRMFVNAPKAYSKRKDQNRVGNSKRPNAKGNDASHNAPPAKRPKVSGRTMRGRSSTTSELPVSRGTTPQPLYESTGLPYMTNPALQRVAASPPTAKFLAPQAPMQRLGPRSQRGSFGQHQVSTMSPRAPPRTAQPQQISRITSVPPNKQAIISTPPPPTSHSHFSAPATADDAKPLNMVQPFSWQQTDAFGEPSGIPFQQITHDDSTMYSGIVNWSHEVPSFPLDEPHGSANIFEHHPEMGVSLADLERLPSAQLDDTTQTQHFETMWGQQHGVQPFSYHDLCSDRPKQP